MRWAARFHWRANAGGLAIAALCAGLSIIGAEILHSTAFVLVFPLGVLIATVRFGVGPAILTAVCGVLVFDFVFVPPAFAFAVPGLKDGVTLGVMVVVAGLAGVLAEQLRRQAHTARRQAEVEHVRNALLSALSHDLRTPLTVLVGASTALCEQQLDPLQREEFNHMVADEARRLNRLVGNLLELTRLEAGNAKVTHTAQAIDEVIGSAMCRLERLLEGRAVETHMAEGVPLAFFDPVLLEQVVINLVENAVRYAGPASPIGVSARFEDETIVVEVADRGPGVPPGDEERVFEKFYRAPGAGHGDGGIGLGLTICRAIVGAHDGRIWLRNRPGGGVAVSFSLPVSSAARALAPPSERTMTEALRS
ncbi:MAG TPA: ATP-binding protein [Polyangiaceae bacterium]|jgi:two-component system sensor histidine kinase KdpD|nr:ATP-binding protein [Polyangiaceae bacterium]